MKFTVEDVKALRERTGCGMMECKEALELALHRLDAVEILRGSGTLHDITWERNRGRLEAQQRRLGWLEGGGELYHRDDADKGFSWREPMLEWCALDLGFEAVFYAASADEAVDAALRLHAEYDAYAERELVPRCMDCGEYFNERGKCPNQKEGG